MTLSVITMERYETNKVQGFAAYICLERIYGQVSSILDRDIVGFSAAFEHDAVVFVHFLLRNESTKLVLPSDVVLLCGATTVAFFFFVLKLFHPKSDITVPADYKNIFSA